MAFPTAKEKVESRKSALSAPASPALPQMGGGDEEEMGEVYKVTRSELQELLDNGGSITTGDGCTLELTEDEPTEAPEAAAEEMAM